MLLLLLNHVVIVVKPCCVEGLMGDRCISTLVNKSLLLLIHDDLEPDSTRDVF